MKPKPSPPKLLSQFSRGRGRLRPTSSQDFPAVVLETAQRARHGSIKAALQLADTSGPLQSADGFLERNGYPNPFPEGVSPDRLEWLRLAASYGSPEAQYRFARDVGTLERNEEFFRQALSDPAARNALLAEARQWLSSAVQQQHIADAYHLAACILQQGGLGLSPDPVSALAFKLVLHERLHSSVSEQILAEGLIGVRDGDLIVARQRSASDLAILLR